MGLKPKIIKPNDFINPLLSKKSVSQEKFEKFQKDLETYKTSIRLQHDSKQSEPNIVSNALKPFFESLGYIAQSFSQKGQSGVDLAIMREHKPCVIIEAKKHNEADMITKSSLHQKSFYEAILYFMRERDGGNNTLFHIIITDFFGWFVFDAKDFDRLFWQNKQIKKIYQNYKNPSILGDNTKDFYENIAKELQKLQANLIDDIEVECAYFNLQEPRKAKDFIAVYKLLSPDALLKEFNPNDANSLNREFYSELLYILGLEEVKDGSKKVIQRAKEPQSGSFYENIANKLTQYTKPNDFETVIKLIIIWINRILFLKLLESQIVSWNKNREFKFLNASKINDYDKLEMLFFEVLAKRPQMRKHREFDHIPYLNSSLFEIHENETKYLTISTLEDDAKINYYSKTILKDDKRAKKSGQTSTIAYLFDFLDAYDFGSTNDEIANESKSLINASVLGLIFEKINGYKDGSFYTPSFITMYMARESLQKSIIEKFNSAFEIEAANFEELKNYCDKYNYKNEFIQKANKIIDSLTICDPAVGSGHFLVSVLNEIIYIKYQLGLFNLRGLKIELINDELLVKLEDEWFEYTKPKDFESPNHKVQKMLFDEKQRIIENQLFGVDINPNSSQITKLRLWIELLKNSYYDTNYELVTLPNIDINIKTGNSLISRFDLKDEIKINNIKHEIKNYKERVREYKENLGTKKEVLASIEELKSKFRLTLKAEYKVTKERNQKLREYVADFGHEGLNDDLLLTAIKNKYGHVQNLFGDKADAKKQAKLLEELTKLEAQIDEIEKGKIYEDAFEWRFEFPEVLDEDGNFIGFDIVIGNPPYISLSKLKDIDYSKFDYKAFDKTGDILALFFEKGLYIANTKSHLSFIVSNSWLKTKYGEAVKKLFSSNGTTTILNFEDTQLFDEATVESCITTISKAKENVTNTVTIKNFDIKNATPNSLNEMIANADGNDEDTLLMKKIESKGKLLKEWDISISYGIKTGFNEAFIIDTAKKEELIAQDSKNAEIIKPLIRGRDVQKYAINYAGFWLINVHNNPPINIDEYPIIKTHLDGYYPQLEKRGDKGKTPYNLRNCAYLADFEKPKIMWGQLSDKPKFVYDESGIFTNQKIFIMTGKNIKYLLAVLNSKITEWYFSKIAVTTGEGTIQWDKYKLELLPIAVA
ncbi:MAG: adenine-specific DNA-methyltransferase, partial [Campylobacterota bacterium]|nr:adenine-specific DNA-methyltransferase [Campylobacterota bacterium]